MAKLKDSHPETSTAKGPKWAWSNCLLILDPLKCRYNAFAQAGSVIETGLVMKHFESATLQASVEF